MRRRFVPDVGNQRWKQLTELLFQVLYPTPETFQFLFLPRDHA